MTGLICVIIAAKDAEATIARAVRSALGEPEIGQVILVDDGSSDGTSAAASAAAGSDDRLTIVRFEHSKGPAAARNHALSACTKEFVAILDADDFILPGRFSMLMNDGGGDLIADNIVFCDEKSDVADLMRFIGDRPAQWTSLTLRDFVHNNLTQRGMRRGELGFLKPVMRTAFLRDNSLRYDETMRLGEDFDLYARMLAKGAQFRLTDHVGYAATIRETSLSSRHSTADLQTFSARIAALLRIETLDEGERDAIRQHLDQTLGRFRHRDYLDRYREHGALRTAVSLASDLPAWRPVVTGLFRDKVTARFFPTKEPLPRLLIPASENSLQELSPGSRT